jgi:hypothetical protein
VDPLVQAAKRAFIQAAIVELSSQGSRVNSSRLSAATGIPRKEISAYRDRSRNRTLSQTI